MIDCTGLTHRYADANALALDGLSLSVPRGECFGFIGANGAGKTTALRILATLIEPTAGRARIADLDVVDHYLDVRRRIGYMPETIAVFPEFRVGEFLEYTAALYGLRGSVLEQRVEAVVALTDLGGKRDQWCGTLSQGMRQRLFLARALVHDPDVLIFDEPTAALDPAARVEFRQIMRELTAAGKTTIVSSHILPELSEFCTSVGIIEKGKLVIAGRVEEVLASLKGARQIDIEVAGDPSAAAALLRARPDVSAVTVEGSHVRAAFAGTKQESARLLRALVEAGIPVVMFGERRATLEEIFMKVAAFETA
jgi:ABC-2 type transport system ATP-binding protein